MNEKKEVDRIKRKLKRSKILSYKAFKEKYIKDYTMSLAKKILHLLDLKGSVPNGYWTKEILKSIALNYKGRYEFQKKSKGAYQAAKKLKIIDEVCSHMEVQNRSRDSWTEEELQKISNKYKRRTDFQSNDGAAYQVAQKLNILDKICSHMPKIKSLHSWTKKELKDEAKKYNTRTDFKKGSNKAYNAAHKLKIIDEICSHMEKRNSWSKNKVIKEAKKYKTKKEFREKNIKAYNTAHKLGIMNEACVHMKQLKKPNGYWTKARIIEEARKYKTKKEFYKKESSGYTAAQVLGILDEVCEHMEELVKPSGYWTKEKVIAEAKRYKTRNKFCVNSSSAYNKARELGILDKVCSHMIFEMDLKEYKFVNQFCKKIEKFYPNIKIKREVKLDKNSRIDIILNIPEFNLKIPIEVKHGDSQWTVDHINQQKFRYDSIIKKKKGYTKTYIVSPRGKWGYSEKEFLEILEHLIKHEELYLPCAVA